MKLLEILSLTCLIVAGFLVAVPVGFAVAGSCGLWVASVAARKVDR